LDKDKIYNKKYYAANRERINKRRREKYANDKEYRERVVRKSREYKTKTRESPKERGRRPGIPPVKYIEVMPGVVKRSHTIGGVANEIGVSIQTIRSWVRKKVIPDTPYVICRYKYWTDDMLVVILRAIVDSRGNDRGLNIGEFSKLVNENWPEYARKGDSNG